MKLFRKYNRLNITAAIIIFVAGSSTFYLLLRYILIHQVDESLQTEQQEITAYIATHHTLPEVIPTRDQHTTIAPAGRLCPVIYKTIKHTPGSDNDDLREIEFGVQAAGQYYVIRVDQPLEETEALLQIIIGVTIAMIALILLISYLINRRVVSRLWLPFYQTIDKVKTFHLADRLPLKLDDEAIEEFSLLNRSINGMTSRIRQDYDTLKSFTGHAAHEMQTPLAIIRARVDALMQHDEVMKEHAIQVTDIENAVSRLSRLFQSLLLLTKVESKAFELNEEVHLHELAAGIIVEYRDMAAANGISMEALLQPVTVTFHRQLSEILVRNLVSNAMRHNKPGGSISISLDDRQLIISNTSASPELDGRELFRRFYKQHTGSEGTGLGLSIVKQICDLAGYKTEYLYAGGKHIFSIYLSTTNPGE